MDAAFAPVGTCWTGLPRVLLRMRRLVLLGVAVPLTVLVGVVSALPGPPGWAALALVPVLGAAWAWRALGRN